MQKVRGHTCLRRIGNIVLPLIVGIRFQVLFHSPSRGTFHLSLTVLVHYRSSSVFSLGEWAPQLPTGLACPVVLRYPARASQFSPTGLSPSAVALSRSIRLTVWFVTLICWALQPHPCKHGWFGLIRVRSPLLAEYSLFLRVVRCFSSPGSLTYAYVFSIRNARFTCVGFPIRISTGYNVCTRLPEAYRSVLRPSSALNAKASTICP